MSLAGRPLPTADVGYPVAHLGGQLFGGEFLGGRGELADDEVLLAVDADRLHQPHDPLDLVAQERTSAAKAEEERLQRERDANDLRHVMSSKQGRRFAYRLLSGMGLYRLSFNAENQQLTAFNEGARNQGIMLLTEIMEACPEI